MTRISFLIHTLFLMPVMIASALAQVKYSEPDRSVVACGVGF